ncbi:MAG: response regulator transcription factor [Anaerolineae bacterium]
MSNPTDLEKVPKIRVLLVDDHEAFLHIATEFLRRHDELTVVGVARGGEEALILAQDLQPQVILVDLNMPGLGGLEIIPRLRSMLPEVGIIALTLLDPKAYRQAALAAGADDFVPKANLSTELLPAIRRVAQTGQPDQEPPIIEGRRTYDED